MKKYTLLIILLCYPTLTLGQQTLSTIPFSTTSTSEPYCWSHSECDDYNPCTSDRCPGNFSHCEFDFNSHSCDDGLYCNGSDACGDGTCSVHSGNPCPAGTVCNEDYDWCETNPVTSTTTSINQGSSTTTTLPTGGSLSISGYVTGATAENVSVVLAGTASVTNITGTDGYYEFSNLVGGYYTLKAEKDGYSFEPPNYVIPNLTSVLVEMNFEATKTRCFVQSIYGEYSIETELLRSIRDNILSKTQEGQELIKLYYQWSPIIVRAIEADEEFKQEVKEMVDGVLGVVE